MNITLDEIRTLSADEIINKMKVVSILPEQDDGATQRKHTISKLKPLLKGFFKPDPSLLRRGAVVHVGEHFLTVSSILNSSDRVFFLFPDDTKEFSVSKRYILGTEDSEFPYKKDDTVLFEEIVWAVVTVNPASNMIEIWDGNIKRKVSANRVKPVEVA